MVAESTAVVFKAFVAICRRHLERSINCQSGDRDVDEEADFVTLERNVVVVY
jgi:hypothetical protein